MSPSWHPAGWLAAVRTGIRALLRRRELERELAEEIRFHLEMETEANVRRGMSQAEARRRANVAFGGVERTRESHRDARGTRWLEDLVGDLRYGARWLARTPGFALSAILTLALGIGGTTAVVCVVDGVLLRPLPYPSPDRLVAVWSITRGDTTPYASSPPDFRVFRDQATSFEELGGYYASATNLLLDGEPTRLTTAHATAGTFAVLGVPPLLGRTFTQEDEVRGADRVVVLSHRAWRTRFGERRSIVGSSVSIEGAPHVVIGVMPPSFRFPYRDAELWLPMAFAADDILNTRGNYFVQIVGRLREGTPLERARAELTRVAAAIATDFPQAPVRDARIVPLHEETVGGTRTSLLLLLAASGLVLTITCANVAGLLLARAAGRRRELALRAGLGATRARLVRQLLAEGSLLSAVGAAAGFGLAAAAVRLMRIYGPHDIPRMDEVGLDGRVLALTVLISVVTGVGFALVPALRLTRGERHDELRGGTRLSAHAGHRRLRRVLVGGQVALALVLLVGSGLLLRSFLALTQVDPGFRASGVVTASLPIRGGVDSQATRVWSFADRLLERIEAMPQVESAALTTGLSLRGGGWGKRISFADRPVPATQEDVPTVGYRLVSHRYFETLGIRLIEGRAFEPQDRAGSPPVAIVNQSMARRFWPGESPLGKTIWMGPPEQMVSSLLPDGFRFPRLTVIGVVADERFAALDVPPSPEVYHPYAQSGETSSGLYLAVRSDGDPVAVVAGIRQALRELNPTMPLAEVATLGQLMRESGARRRFGAILVGAFAALALGLALVGVCGVAAQFVAQRRRELAIRLALGATDTRVVRLVLWEGLATALVGAAVGVVTALALGGPMREVTFEVAPTDPLTYVTSAAVLLAAIAAAVTGPARRAARLPPAAALGSE